MKETIKKIICELIDVTPDEIKDDTKLESELGMDSLDCLELIVYTEKAYNIEFESNEMDELTTPRETGVEVTFGMYCDTLDKILRKHNKI